MRIITNSLIAFFLLFLQCGFAQNVVDSVCNHPIIAECVLAYEDCSSTNYNFCHDGIEQSSKLFPFFIKLNKDDFIKSYDTVVFSFINFNHAETEDEYYYPFKMDSVLNNLCSDYNLVTVYSEATKVKVNSTYKRLNMKKRFDGYMHYHLFRVKFEYIDYGETMKIADYYLFGHTDEKCYPFKCIRYASIKKVLSIEPIKGYNMH